MYRGLNEMTKWQLKVREKQLRECYKLLKKASVYMWDDLEILRDDTKYMMKLVKSHIIEAEKLIREKERP